MVQQVAQPRIPLWCQTTTLSFSFSVSFRMKPGIIQELWNRNITKDHIFFKIN